MVFNSITYGQLELEQVPDKICDYINKMKHYETPFQITVGTDSQNFSDTKIVTVIVVTCEGHGGIYFYNIARIKKINDLAKKLEKETDRSLSTMTKLISIIESDEEKYGLIKKTSLFSIHIDAGEAENCKTKELIPQLVGWIKGMGYDCVKKPDSYAASSVADRLSK